MYIKTTHYAVHRKMDNLFDGLITSKTLEATARQPELKSKLWLDMFVFAGLMEAFPFIILGLAFWLIFANPFPGLLHIGK